jgi:ribosomal protein S14
MDTTGDNELIRAVRDFVERIGALDVGPEQPTAAQIEVRQADARTTFSFSARLADAFAAALRAYHDPRDQGRCEHCGGSRLDDNLICVDCGRAHGIFGQLLMERAARYEDDGQ